MATDGIKIIDGDMAHGIYSSFMDIYDNEATTIDILKQKYENDKQKYIDDKFDYEICVTAYALAFWEIGAMTADILKDVEDVIEKKAAIDEWTIEGGEKLGKAREKELEKFWTKINTPKEKPRKSKRYKTVFDALFKQDDIVAFKSLSNDYHVTIVVDISIEKGKCYYTFCRTELELRELPKITDVENVAFVGSIYGINRTPHLWGVELEHSKLKKCFQEFQLIGNININRADKRRNYYQALSYNDFCNKFHLNDTELEQAKLFGRTIHRFSLKELTK